MNYTTQLMMENFIGADNIKIWSNRDSSINATTTADPTAIQDVKDRTDRYLNRRFRTEGYITPIPESSQDYGYIQDLATVYAVCLLYMGRPETVSDSPGDAADSIAGNMRNHMKKFRGDLDELMGVGLDATRLSPRDNHGISVVTPGQCTPLGLPGPQLA